MSDQTILATTLAVLMALLIWGKWRYDGVTLVCLAALVLFGVVPAESAFSGFGHPAVITVALVLLISRGLQEAGMVSLAGNLISRLTLSQNQYMIMIMIVAAFLSSFMNNIGAMALLLPITLSLCQKMEWNPSKFLMPLAFASILGGMNTVIGTPPNIIIAQYRQEYTGVAFSFFDYSFVGLAVSILGVLFIALIGFRFVKVRDNTNDQTSIPLAPCSYVDDIMQEYYGIDTYHVLADPNNEYIDHIDCWGKYLSPHKVLIREVPTWHAQYDEIEEVAEYFANTNTIYGEPWEVFRVYTGSNQPYTNSLILCKV